MKKIANFTQTYKNNTDYTWGADFEDREYLFDYLIKDKTSLWLRSKLDFHNISFHNYDKEGAKKILDKVSAYLPDTKGFIYNKMTYAQSFKTHLEILKNEHGITDIFWIQDDEFFIYNHLSDIEELLNYYRNDPTLINVQFGVSSGVMLNKNKTLTDSEGEIVNDSLILHRTTCNDFNNFWPGQPCAFPSGACICSIDLLLQILSEFGDHLYTKNAYDVEGLMGMIGLKHNLQRCSLNIPLLKAYNITGMGGSLAGADKNREELNIRL